MFLASLYQIQTHTMKKILITALALALPALGSAQTLMSGYNFGQFLGGGIPSLDGTTGAFVGSVGSNFTQNVQAPANSSGAFVGQNELPGDYSNGTGRAYWDGSNGSSNYAFNGIAIVATDTGANGVNSLTLPGYQMGLIGDDLNLGLTSTVAGNSISFLQNTVGFGDYAGPVANLTFAAASQLGSTINWSLLGTGLVGSTNVASGGNFAVYSIDLPAAFYGVAAAQLSAQFGGSVTIDNVQFNALVTPIPEPSTYAAILGALTLGVVAIRRRKSVVAA